MTTLIFVRSIDDIHSALMAVNEFLACRRSYDCLQQQEEMIGLCIRTSLELGLPGLFWFDGVLAKSSVSGQVPHLVEAGIGIRESISLSGIWSHCWLDGPLLRNACSASEQRELILRVLVNTRSLLGLSQEPEVFFPVFNKNEPAYEVAAEMRSLQTRYHGLIGLNWLRHDRAWGLTWPDEPKAGPALRQD